MGRLRVPERVSAGRRDAPLLPAPPVGTEPAPTTRDLLFRSWAGRLFLVSAAIKLFVFMLRLAWRATCTFRNPGHHGDPWPDSVAGFFRLEADHADAKPPALAGAAEVDHLLHLHRGRPGTPDHRLLHAGCRPGLDERQRVPVQGWVRRDRRGRGCAHPVGRARHRSRPFEGLRDSPAQPAGGTDAPSRRRSSTGVRSRSQVDA